MTNSEVIQLSDIHFIVKTGFGISAACLFTHLYIKRKKHLQLHLRKPCSSVNMRSTEIKSHTTTTYWQSLWVITKLSCQKKREKKAFCPFHFLNQQSFKWVLTIRCIQLVNMHVCFANRRVKTWGEINNMMNWQHIHNNRNAFLHMTAPLYPTYYSKRNNDSLLYWGDTTTY